jgi:hypothetical protein
MGGLRNRGSARVNCEGSEGEKLGELPKERFWK